jgi:dihydroneopterin aldolase
LRIYIEDFKFQTIIGILDFERHTPQDVVINLIAEYDYSDGDFINYVKLRDLIKHKMVREKFELLEEALISIINEIEKSFPKITFIRLKISKPSILEDSNVSVEMEKRI